MKVCGWRETLLIVPIIMLLPLEKMTRGSPDWRALRVKAPASGMGPWTVTTAVRTSAFWGLFVAYLFTSVAAYSVLAGYLWLLVTWGLHLRGKPAGGAPKRKPRGAARKPARA